MAVHEDRRLRLVLQICNALLTAREFTSRPAAPFCQGFWYLRISRVARKTTITGRAILIRLLS